MSQSKRKMQLRQAEHAKAKRLRQLESAGISSVNTSPKKKGFKEYAPKNVYRRETERYVSAESQSYDTSKRESQKYTGDLIVGIATLHKSNAVPVMRGTKQAEEISRMRRN